MFRDACFSRLWLADLPTIGDGWWMLAPSARVSQYTEAFQPTWTDFGGYLDAVQRNQSTLNLAVQVGHGTVRAAVMGMQARGASGDELERMNTLVAESLDAGAMGFSTGLFYAPGNYARLEEVIDLAAVASARGKLYSTHMRDGGVV